MAIVNGESTATPSVRSLRSTVLATDVGDRQIEGAGTAESVWWDHSMLHRLPSLALADLLSPTQRLVVVAPHPDDEVLGCGGLLSMATRGADEVPRRHQPPLLIGVTDGEGSHPDSVRWPPSALIRQRSCERARGLAALGSGVSLRLLHVPDGQVTQHEAALVQTLATLLCPDDLVVTTWRLDGHPDHEACGRACAVLSHRVGFRLLEMPVWMWHWAAPGDARVPWHRLVQVDLPEVVRQRKLAALRAHRSQIEPDDERPAVLPPTTLERVRRPSEFFFREDRA